MARRCGETKLRPIAEPSPTRSPRPRIASEIYSTAGHYDLLVKFYVENDTDIGHFVNEKVQTLRGIQDTHTIITFKAFGGG
jgi:DNA-binding Lrp family transcriptional regulator